MKVSKCKINSEDGYVCSYKQDGKRRRKYFYSRKDAEKWKSEFGNAASFEEKQMLTLLKSQLEDICAALKILPKGKTLTEAVSIAFSNLSNANLKNLGADFAKTKKASGVSTRHYNIVKNRVNAFVERFQNFNNATPQATFDFIASKGLARKTTIEWFNTINEFLKFCIRRDAIKTNPLEKWAINDFGRPKTKKKPRFIAVSTADEFIHFIQASYPQYLKYFALTMFSGIRVSEVLRIKEKYIDYEKKSISLPAEITKKKRAEHLTDFEPNLWSWLNLLKDAPIQAPTSNTRQRIYAKFSLPQNFARHSFATYHYSLYRDPIRTAAITHHSPQQLMNDYMDALVDKETAKAYFEILPVG